MVLAASLKAPQPETVPGPNGLERLQALVSDDLAAVNRLIVEKMQSEVALIPQLAGHIVAAGGKRLRPLLTLATARLCGYEGEHDMPEDWRVYAWSAGEGFGAQAKERSGNGKRERVWFSPACLDEEQPTLFANQCGSNTTTTQGA